MHSLHTSITQTITSSILLHFILAIYYSMAIPPYDNMGDLDACIEMVKVSSSRCLALQFSRKRII